MNQVALVGRIVRPITAKQCNGTSVVNNTLAINGVKKEKSDGSTADFIPIVAWGKVAEQLEKYVKKGHRVGITGYLKSRSYVNKLQQKVSVVEVVVNHVYFLENPPKEKLFLRQFEVDSNEEN